MKYIKACPDCGRMLRFPIDKGVIKVSCQCGFSIIIDPDNTELYKEGKFDLTRNNKKNKVTLKSVLKKFSYSKIINSLLELKYKLQNLSLMPDAEKNRFILKFLAVTAAIIVILYIIIR